MRVAIVHDWLTGMRGGERCLEVFCELFPEADLYTLIYLPDRVSPVIQGMKVHASWINNLPGVKRYYRYCLPFFPNAIESFELKGYDLILSSSHCVAKGAIRPRGALHISYTYTPMRYVWDLYDAYFGDRFGAVGSMMVQRLTGYLRHWDLEACERVDHFVAISYHVAKRIKRLYGREAVVIYPPVDIERFQAAKEEGDYYLVVSAFAPYKRIDLAVRAFNDLRLPLKVVGWGPEERRLRKLAGPTVEFLGGRSDEEVSELYTRCRALVFPGEEDFGIVPLEAQASGRPVIAYGKGGVLETVIPLNPRDFTRDEKFQSHKVSDVDGPTGIFFYEQTPEALVAAVKLFEQKSHRFAAKRLRDHALKFDKQIFKAKIRSFIEEKWLEHQRSITWPSTSRAKLC